MKRLFLMLALILLPNAAMAVPVDLGTFAPAGLPICTLTATDPTALSTSPTLLQAHIGDTITIALVVTNGTFSQQNIIRVNNNYEYNVTLPILVTASTAGQWALSYVSPGCSGNTVTVTTQ